LTFLTQNKAKLCKILIITLVFEKNAKFLAKKCRKSQKIVIITSTPGELVSRPNEALPFISIDRQVLGRFLHTSKDVSGRQSNQNQVAAELAVMGSYRRRFFISQQIIHMCMTLDIMYLQRFNVDITNSPNVDIVMKISTGHNIISCL
jgi:hypothetical protein